MSDPADPFAAKLLELSRHALAAGAARRLVERDPELAARWSPRPFERWRESLEARLRDLGASLTAGDPRLFVDQVRWARVAFGARSLPLDDLAQSLIALREELSLELGERARASLELYLSPALAALAGPLEMPPEHLDLRSEAGKLAARYLERLLAGEREEAYALVLGAAEAGRLELSTLLVEVLAPVVRQLGRLWHTGELSVADEHLATAATRALAERLVGRAAPRPTHGKRVLAATIAGDAHDFGLALVSYLYELDGWRVLFLGADVPSSELADLARRLAPDLLLLSATLPWQRPTAARAIEELRAAHESPILIGGAAFPDAESARRAGADAWASDAREALARGRELVGLAAS